MDLQEQAVRCLEMVGHASCACTNGSRDIADCYGDEARSGELLFGRRQKRFAQAC